MPLNPFQAGRDSSELQYLLDFRGSIALLALVVD